MRIQLTTLAIAAVLSAGWSGPVRAAVVYSPSADIVLTDPLVRSIQIGPAPVGLVSALDPRTGIGLVAIPGIGVRRAQLVGVPVSWSGQPALRAMDLDTAVEFTALLPSPPQLVPATVVRSIGDSILVRRRATYARVTEAVPVGSVFASTRGGLAPATRVRGALQPGSTVLIPGNSRSRALVIVPK